MKILVDTNVILDIVLAREPFFPTSAHLFKGALEAGIEVYLSATTITDLYYIARKAKGRTAALAFIEDLLGLVEVAAVDKAVILHALKSEIYDFEDAVQESAAVREGITAIVTRDAEDFRASHLTIHSPESFLNDLA
jgi:predicted nucleic acid-binding protein